MKNLSKTQLLSLIVGVISAMAGLITTLGQTWGFAEIANQIGETCFAISGFANIIFFGITVQKAKENTVFEDAEKQEATNVGKVVYDVEANIKPSIEPAKSIDGVIR